MTLTPVSNKAYYNELDPKAAAWLRELIKGGHIAPGDVDERSIEDIRPADLRGYTQHHFFAGIGGWSYALRLAGWPDDKPVWTGSCPCQPFSTAGKGKGFADERHLWPAWFHLIRELRPDRIFGEQVANALGWLDLISTDLEEENYAIGAAIVGAHSVGAPHIRQRLYWAANANSQRHHGQHARLRGENYGRHTSAPILETAGSGETSALADRPSQRLHTNLTKQQPEAVHHAGEKQSERCSAVGQLANAGSKQQQHGRGRARAGRRQPTNDGELGHANDERPQRRSESRDGADERAVGPSGVVDLEHAESDGREQRRSESGERSAFSGCGESVVADANGRNASAQREQRSGQHGLIASHSWACDWIPCTDGKSRPVEPGTFPLAHGIPGRVGLLRGYGNAIVPQDAAEFINAS